MTTSSDEPAAAVRRKPAAPRDLEKRGRAFWREVVAGFDLDLDERQLLAEACRTMDVCDRLREHLAEDGSMILGSKGQQRLHPAVAELRQQRAALARLLGQLALPDDDGVPLPTLEQRRATKAAQARWSQKQHLDQQRRLRAQEGTDHG